MDNPIVFNNVDHIYNAGSPFAVSALKNVNLSIPKGKITAIIGHTGSGKSTLIQHLNVLLRPTHGTVKINDVEITADSKNKNLKALRKQVSVVFQFPESQLFEETVLKDVMFGPLNFGVSEEEAERIAREKLSLVGLPENLYDRSPFDLSGGQMRRVAIAGVLALEPSVLVLDEPTAGLDPAGQKYMLEMFVNLHRQQNLTLVLVTHQMEDVALYADNVIVMENGTVVKTGEPLEIFKDEDKLETLQLSLPHSLQFFKDIDTQLDTTYIKETQPITVDQLADEIVKIKQSRTLKSEVSQNV
ncbi:energy-coupling factor ABC transporter ATP-binding protein [Ruoffia tabacinasalis]|uniref:Energy-coupling factor transporter ATP-binding protein EcfA2 n=1 Tax=Ruoffia tabacinasalis TaxID=87458 RepID=A0A5R9DZS5_9LACT|nr:energy-coupling factor ABC transporter ATP-binding protein [Ruoffia tabacinasalis]MBG9977457.1 energy-coupling factor ABC transporter ATP-binding protein [Ruoffia tabacinasalis]TLQ41576.1 energy-coupling factor ABC transporter ATP-binding protein [Ruoffia tabacinasalis]